MDAIKPPRPLQLSGNVRRNWELFKQRLDLFLTATSPEKQRTEAVKAVILLSTAGEKALEIFNKFTFRENELNNDYPTLVHKFDEYCLEQGTRVKDASQALQFWEP